MPRSIPNINNRPSIREELGQLPQPAEVLGTVSPQITDPSLQGPTTLWTGPAGAPVEMSEPPPPWELEDTEYAPSDARRYVDVPDTWTLRWINPKLLESTGWRYWQPVMASDPRVKVKVDTMIGPDNNIRRGGVVGDILGWMYTTWVISRRAQLQKETESQTQSAADRHETLKNE